MNLQFVIDSILQTCGADNNPLYAVTLVLASGMGFMQITSLSQTDAQFFLDAGPKATITLDATVGVVSPMPPILRLGAVAAQ